MVDNLNPEEIKVPEKKVAPNEEWSDFGKERLRSKERKEISVDETRVVDQIRQEMELMDSDEKLKEEAKQKALKIEFLGEKEKIEHLLKIAREQGVEKAIRVAKETRDPYLLDMLHDILAREGFYKKMSQSAGNGDDDDNDGDNKK